MAWTPQKIQALLLKTPPPVKPIKLANVNRPARQPSPRGAAANQKSSYSRD